MTLLNSSCIAWEPKILIDKISDERNELRFQSKHRVLIGHLNIDSVRNKFEEWKMITANNLDIILISETKLDASFPSKQFLIDGHSPPYIMDLSNTGGGLICFIRETTFRFHTTAAIYRHLPPPRTDIYRCFFLFTAIYRCLPLSTGIYRRSLLFDDVYRHILLSLPI